METAPFILELGLREQVPLSRPHCKVRQARGPRNEAFREAGYQSCVGQQGNKGSDSSL